MPDSLVLQNVLSPPILFYFLGALADFVGSDLEVPQPVLRRVGGVCLVTDCLWVNH